MMKYRTIEILFFILTLILSFYFIFHQGSFFLPQHAHFIPIFSIIGMVIYGITGLIAFLTKNRKVKIIHYTYLFSLLICIITFRFIRFVFVDDSIMDETIGVLHKAFNLDQYINYFFLFFFIIWILGNLFLIHRHKNYKRIIINNLLQNL